MQDRFNTLAERFRSTHIPLTIIEGEHGNEISHRALLMRDMTIRDLRAEAVENFAQDGALKSEYMLTVDEQPLDLNATVGTLRPNARVVMEKVERKQAVQDLDIFLVFDDGSIMQVEKLPAIIGRSRNIENSEVEINLIDQPDGQTVSRRHAELAKSAGGYTIQNLTDKALYVNDQPLTSQLPQSLHDNDILRLGRVTMKLRLQAKADAEEDAE